MSELLLRGANVNAKTEYGYPPLNYAARGFFDAARLLVENSADLRAKDANHRKPAYYAADHPMLAQVNPGIRFVGGVGWNLPRRGLVCGCVCGNGVDR